MAARPLFFYGGENMKTFIGHIDTLMNYDRKKDYNFFSNEDFHVDIVKMKKAGLPCLVL